MRKNAERLTKMVELYNHGITTADELIKEITGGKFEKRKTLSEFMSKMSEYVNYWIFNKEDTLLGEYDGKNSIHWDFEKVEVIDFSIYKNHIEITLDLPVYTFHDWLDDTNSAIIVEANDVYIEKPNGERIELPSTEHERMEMAYVYYINNKYGKENE